MRFKHLFFDMDGTITRSRSLVTPEMKAALDALKETVIVVSGQPSKAIKEQLDGADVDFLLGGNGNDAFDYRKGKQLWKNELSSEERDEIMEHIRYFESVRDWDVKNSNDLIEDRISQISYSCIGHHEDIAKKEAFDPGGSFRKKLLEENPRPLRLTDVKVAGTTTFDYFKKGSNKGSNILRLINAKGWKKEECVYFGDALYPGGNDEAVLGVIEVQKVDDPAETLKIIKEHYLA